MHGCVARSVAEGSSTPFVLVSSSTRCSPRHLVFAVERKVPEGIHLAEQRGGRGKRRHPKKGNEVARVQRRWGAEAKCSVQGRGATV